MAKRHALGALIETVRAANNWSYSDVEHRARRADREISRSNVERLSKQPVRRIDVDTLTALAAGLRLPEETVMLAAMASAGIDLAAIAARSPEQAVEADPALSEDHKGMILTLLSTMRGAHADTSEEDAVGSA